MVLLDCGLDNARREVAGPCTLLMARLTESSGAERLAACRPWGRALLCRLRPRGAGAEQPAPRRVLVIDGRGIQGPGARGSPYRLHLCLDLVTWAYTCIALTEKRTGGCVCPPTTGPWPSALARPWTS